MKPKDTIEEEIKQINDKIVNLKEDYEELRDFKESLDVSNELDVIFFNLYGSELNRDIETMIKNLSRKKEELKKWESYKEDPTKFYNKFGFGHNIYDPQPNERKDDETFKRRKINENKSNDRRLRDT